MGKTALLCLLSLSPFLALTSAFGGLRGLAFVGMVGAPILITMIAGWLLSSDVPREALPELLSCPRCGEQTESRSDINDCPMCGWNRRY